MKENEKQRENLKASCSADFINEKKKRFFTISRLGAFIANP